MRNGLTILLIRHGCAGAAAGWLTVGLLLWTDTAGIGLLVAASDLWPIPLIMLLWSFGVTFASLAMGAAVMSIDRRAEPRWGAREWRWGRRWLLALRCWRSPSRAGEAGTAIGAMPLDGQRLKERAPKE